MPVTPKAKAVVLAMQTFDGGDGIVWPSWAALREATGLSRTAVYGGICELVECGAIEVVERGGGAGRSTRYRLTGKPFVSRTVRDGNGSPHEQNGSPHEQNSSPDEPEVPLSAKEEPDTLRGREWPSPWAGPAPDESNPEPYRQVVDAWTAAGVGLVINTSVARGLRDVLAAHSHADVLNAIESIAKEGHRRPNVDWIPDRIARAKHPDRRGSERSSRRSEARAIGAAVGAGDNAAIRAIILDKYPKLGDPGREPDMARQMLFHGAKDL